MLGKRKKKHAGFVCQMKLSQHSVDADRRNRIEGAKTMIYHRLLDKQQLRTKFVIDREQRNVLNSYKVMQRSSGKYTDKVMQRSSSSYIEIRIERIRICCSDTPPQHLQTTETVSNSCMTSHDHLHDDILPLALHTYWEQVTNQTRTPPHTHTLSLSLSPSLSLL